MLKRDRYWEVMDFLASDKLDAYKKGTHILGEPIEKKPQHINFI